MMVTTRSNRNSQEITSQSNQHQSRVLTRSSGPARVPCTHYGVNRETDFPGFFFCHPCKMKDDNLLCGAKFNASTKKYLCIANHQSWTFPTQVKEQPSRKYGSQSVKKKRKINDNPSQQARAPVPGPLLSSPQIYHTKEAIQKHCDLQASIIQDLKIEC